MPEEPEITTLGEKGQVVIPKRLRDHLGMKPKTKFVVFGDGDVIVLKRLELLDVKAEWERIFASSGTRAAQPTEEEVADEVAAARRARREKKG